MVATMSRTTTAPNKLSDELAVDPAVKLVDTFITTSCS